MKFCRPENKTMPLERILEPEVMDSPDEASDYDAMDHGEVNRRFVHDLVERVQGSGFRVWEATNQHSVFSTRYSVPSTESSSLSNHSLAPAHAPTRPTLASEPRTLNPEPSAEPFLDILDLGTGTALIPIELCKQFANCRVMAADAAVSMLEIARYNVEVNSLIERIELVHVDAKRLPFGDAMFDVVMSNSIVHHIPAPIDALREAVRVAKPGGLLFFRDLLRPGSQQELDHLVAAYTAGANDRQRRMFAESLHAALSLAEIRGLIVSLGYEAASVEPTSDRHWTWACRRQ
jgi:ubiquinone/menaquinone biosynthesis C-methylase UbiE